MKEPPCFDGIGSDHTICSGWVQTFEDYFDAKGCLGEESFMIAIQKLQGYAQYWFKCLRIERALKGKPRIKHGVGSNHT